MRVRGATSQLDLPSMTPLSVAGCGRLQLGVPHWATSIYYCKQLIIDPTFCGSRFSTGRLLAIEDFIFFHASLLTFFVSIFDLFNSFCSNARVFGKTLVHESHIYYGPTFPI